MFSFSFLYDEQSPAHRFYKQKVQEYRATVSKSLPTPSAAAAGTNLQQPAANPSSSPHSTEADNPPVKRKRKSRWGSEDERVELPVPQIVIPPEISVPDPDAPTLSGEWTWVYYVFLFVWWGK